MPKRYPKPDFPVPGYYGTPFPSATEADERGRSLAWYAERSKRRMANWRMSQFRAVPRRRLAHKIVLTASEVTERFLTTTALKSLPASPTEFFIRGRRLARTLVDIDRRAGGDGFAVTWEYRRCLVCKRVLIGPDAADYRELCRRPKSKWTYPQGPACGIDCKLKETRCKKPPSKR